MSNAQHQNLVGFIWNIANKLRGPYRPPQYRRVMLPLIVLRRFDLVLAENKQKVLDEKKRLEDKGITGPALEKALSRIAAADRKQELFNTSGFTFEKLLGDAPNIAGNLIAYIQGFSPRARDIFDKFEFETEIAKLDEANRLYLIIKEFCSADINLSPKAITNLQMGYLFEELVRKFNEQANEEAGDHFTPREVIRLMVELVFTGEDGIFEPGIYRSVYDPTAGTGGMLSESEKAAMAKNPQANIELFGQEYNPESYAICCSDLLIKDEPINNLIYGDTLGIKDAKNKTNGFVPHDGHPDKKFHYMLANPPFGVEWKPEEDFVREEYKDQGFSGRFGAGLPRINDGSLLFLQHMISKMHQPPKLVDGKNVGGDGSKIAIVFNGSPLFTGDAGSGESNIRRWIIERDMLDAIVALPDQMFYNTGIYTYVWIVTNKKPAHRQGKVQLIDGTRHFKKMDKSLGNKRNELTDDHIRELVRLYAEHDHDAESEVLVDGKPERRVCSKLFENREFGFLKITVERPLRLNFQASAERIAKLDEQSAFVNLASSKKRKDDAAYRAEIAAGQETQAAIKAALQGMDSETLYRNRPAFEAVLEAVLKKLPNKVPAPVKKAILAALSERDPKADICLDAKGNPEPDADLRDTEIVALPEDIALPLPLGYGDGGSSETGHDKLLALVKDHCEDYLKAEVLPHVPDAWIAHDKTRVGYEIPLTRHFYVYQPPRPLEEIAGEISQLEKDIVAMLGEVV